MTTLTEIFYEASRLGVTVRLAPGGRLEISPAGRVPAWFVDVVSDHKTELVAWLETRAARFHLCKQVLTGEFEGCDFKTTDRLIDRLNRLPCTAVRGNAIMRLMDVGEVPE